MQTVNLAPSQGDWVEFTLDEEGTYPFVTHAFGDMVKGALGVLATPHAQKGAGHDMGGAPKAAAAKADVNTTMGEMFIKADKTKVKAGKVTFGVKNTGATMHGLAITPAPAKLDGGLLDEKAFIAQGEHLSGGQSTAITADLKPGRYELVCHIAGHCQAGQKLPFEVVS